MDGASKSTLENEFGTKNEDEAIVQILEKGDLQEVEVRISRIPILLCFFANLDSEQRQPPWPSW